MRLWPGAVPRKLEEYLLFTVDTVQQFVKKLPVITSTAELPQSELKKRKLIQLTTQHSLQLERMDTMSSTLSHQYIYDELIEDNLARRHIELSTEINETPSRRTGFLPWENTDNSHFVDSIFLYDRLLVNASPYP